MKFKILVNLFLISAVAEFVGGKSQQPFELDEFINGVFSNRGFGGVWMSGDTFHYRDTTTRDVYKFNVETEEREILFTNSVLSNFSGAGYTLSPDNSFVLIRYDVISIFRHSTTSKYTIYDLASGEYYPVGNEQHLSYATWSPNGKSLVYILGNNIFYVPTPGSAEVQITTDGNDVVYNGVPDWVYEEEVLSSGSAVWFSPDGTKLAFAHFNDTNVKEFNYFLYESEVADQYPEVVSLRYPKVNTTNPDFEVRVVSLTNPTIISTLPILMDDQESRDYVLFRVTWPTNEEVVTVVENRIQNQAWVRRCSLQDLTCVTENYFEEENGWLELEAPIYNEDGTQCLLLLSQQEDDDSYMHLVLYDTVSKTSNRLTYGRRVVSGISGWDKVNNIIYYYGPAEDKPFTQHLYYYNLTAINDTCITCSYQTPYGECLYATASFSKDYSYFAEICQGPGPNFISINTVNDLEWAKVYEDNAILRAQLSEKLRPIIADFDVPLESGFIAKARLLLPPDVDLGGSTKYPVIVNVYGGPDSNQITERFSTGFQNYAVTNRKYIYAYIDGRGSGKKGDKMRFQIYKGMGTVEIQDQIAVMKSLRDSLPYIDPSKIGIWGWSYGGFATAWVLVQDVENVFRLGLSVAPVTDFTLYDTIYTERYMGLLTPEDNEVGYNRTDVTRNVEGLRNKSFFLIHGNADDNVHYQQSMLLARALEQADIMFYQMSYPDENHSLTSVYPHLYHTIDRFFARCFGLPDPVYRHVAPVDDNQLS
ncbi:hypothetical protein Trydic_g20209 [Trypoxylus dichotomus]